MASLGGLMDLAAVSPASAQGFTYNPLPPRPKPPKAANDNQMLVQATEVDYDYNNSRVSAVGNVQLFYNGTSVEADRVIYDQKTKRLHAEGNIRMTDADGKITYAEIWISPTTTAMALSIRCGWTPPTRPAWPRPAPTAPAATTRCSRTASTRPAHRAGTIRRSRRYGRSRVPASSTTSRRRCCISRRRSSNFLACRSPTCPISRRPTRP